MIGRKRETLASTTASQTVLPAARSASIWSIRITAFLAIMPIRARMPRMATKPSGLPESQQRGDHADQAQRHQAQHHEQPRGSS